MAILFSFAMGILAAVGYYYWSFWQLARDHSKKPCACGREVSVVTFVITGGYTRNTLVIPQCEACYEWLLHGKSYCHPPWSKYETPKES